MRGTEHLHPKMKAKAEALQKLCAAKGLPLLITETLRTMAEQNALYAQGRDKNGNVINKGKVVTNCKGDRYQSPHQWGVAFDFCRNVKGKEYDDRDGFFKAVGAAGKSIGLVWGGDWKSFVDKPHLELPEYLPGSSTKTLKAKYGTPEKFIAGWGAAPPAKAPARPVLRRGAIGAAVAELQKTLTARGHKLVADGRFGPLTEAAVKAFQKAKGLVVDGIAGPLTWGKLDG